MKNSDDGAGQKQDDGSSLYFDSFLCSCHDTPPATTATQPQWHHHPSSPAAMSVPTTLNGHSYSDHAMSSSDVALYLRRLELPQSVISNKPSLSQLSTVLLAHHEQIPKDTSPLHIPEADWKGDPDADIVLGESTRSFSHAQYELMRGYRVVLLLNASRCIGVQQDGGTTPRCFLLWTQSDFQCIATCIGIQSERDGRSLLSGEFGLGESRRPGLTILGNRCWDRTPRCMKMGGNGVPCRMRCSWSIGRAAKGGILSTLDSEVDLVPSRQFFPPSNGFD
jgi:hypothetical protein